MAGSWSGRRGREGHPGGGPPPSRRGKARTPIPPTKPIPVFCFFNDTATTEIYTLSLHDALPISVPPAARAALTRASPHGGRGAMLPCPTGRLGGWPTSDRRYNGGSVIGPLSLRASSGGVPS